MIASGKKKKMAKEGITIEYSWKDIIERLDKQFVKISEVLIEAKKTNGRITMLEHQIIKFRKRMKFIEGKMPLLIISNNPIRSIAISLFIGGMLVYGLMTGDWSKAFSALPWMN